MRSVLLCPGWARKTRHPVSPSPASPCGSPGDPVWCAACTAPPDLMRLHPGLLLLALLLALAGLTGCGAVIDQVRTDTDDEVLAALGGEPNILAMGDTADSFGVTSAGVGQIRGNGCLAATAEGLLFVQWAPRKRLWIPRARILKVGGSNAHLGKSTGDALLRVEFRTEAGLVDSAAWLVHDLPTWLAELRSASDPDPGPT